MTNLSPLLDFLIAFVYVLAICSTLLSLSYELVSYWLRSRAYYLHKVLDEVLNDNKLNKINLTELIYNFPQVDFTKITYKDNPMYISSENFAKTLVHSFNNYFQQKNMILPAGSDTPVPILNLPEDPMQLFKTAVANLNPSDLKILLETFVKSSANNYEKLIKNVETWYNEYMDRVTGWFKVRSQKRMILLAIPMAIVLNLNFFEIGKKLFTDKASTAVLVNMAEQWKPAFTDTIRSKEQFIRADSLKRAIMDSLQKANVPMGWTDENRSKFLNQSLEDKIFTFLGWLAMALTMVMGAPFWYDLLNKLVNMRKAGLKPNTDTSKTSN